ncbi:MAG TPA: hypothetical protein VG010_07000 [Solirubrobacteraceae bacterium]|jgi:hypothetical protein|nr:hypothetical protein [Solirubrobacteraceae bacterium]
MHLWIWILLVTTLVIKLPIIALMLWIPFRNDEAMSSAPDTPGSSEEDGGSKALPGGPLNPHPRTPLPRWPRWPRRGPHGSPPCPPPQRVRTALQSRRRVSTSH